MRQMNGCARPQESHLGTWEWYGWPEALGYHQGWPANRVCSQSKAWRLEIAWSGRLQWLSRLNLCTDYINLGQTGPGTWWVVWERIGHWMLCGQGKVSRAEQTGLLGCAIRAHLYFMNNGLSVSWNSLTKLDWPARPGIHLFLSIQYWNCKCIL